MRIYTCTPVAFGGGMDFFSRDSGLLCKGFQSTGHHCRAVMPLPADDADLTEDLIRTHASNLEDTRWWRSLNPDMVVLYAWGRPRFARVAAAIRRSGAFLVLNQDNGGLVSPLAGFASWLREQWILSGQGEDFHAWMKAVRLTARGLTIGLAITDPLRAEHLSHGHVIACVSPKAAEYYRRICRFHGGNALAEQIVVSPHPVETRFLYQGQVKQRKVICVGRWRDEVQKRPKLLVSALGELLDLDPEVTVEIAGEPTERIHNWHQALPPGNRRRVSLRGLVSRMDLARLMAESEVFYSPSAFESFGIAAAEALCSGCSVVAERSVSMASFEWFTAEESGCLIDDGNASSHAAALHKELDAWKLGSRCAGRISETWRDRLHADQVARQLLALRTSTYGLMDGYSVSKPGI